MFRSLSAGVLAMALAVAGCGDDDGGSSSENLGSSNQTTSTTAAGGAFTGCKTEGASTEAAAQEIVVTLGEFTIKPATQGKAGLISFKAENAGAETHEIVVVKADKAEGIPMNAEGAADEDKLPEGAVIGEIEGFPGGQVCSGTFNLAAGKYVLLCNIVETEPNGEKEAHFKEGMHTPFTVS